MRARRCSRARRARARARRPARSRPAAAARPRCRRRRPRRRRPPGRSIRSAPKPALAAAKAFDAARARGLQGAERHDGVAPRAAHAADRLGARSSSPTAPRRIRRARRGLAHITADMLDEGAGTRNAVELSTRRQRSRAPRSATGADADGSVVSLHGPEEELQAGVRDLQRRRGPARASTPKEWKRVSDLWKNELAEARRRIPAPSRASSWARRSTGPDSPYGHPSDGLRLDRGKIDLAAR